MKPTLLHCPLEPYKARYTEFLAEWEQTKLSSEFNVKSIIPQDAQQRTLLDIKTGSVLDTVARPQWSMQQIQSLITENHIRRPQQVYFSDFYTTGLDALAYAEFKGKLYSFCWAQSWDMYDFTTKHVSWMRQWELMAMTLYRKVFVACEELKELMVAANPFYRDQIEVVGLPFDSKHVSKQIDPAEIGEQFDVIYTSRWDTEKQPWFFLDMVELRDDLKFVVCTGWDTLRGTDTGAIRRANELYQKGKLQIFSGCSKGKYYATLSASKIQFNCALQDWISFTLLEALTFGCNPLYPCFRSFPAALNHSEANLYRPGDIVSANEKLDGLLARKGAFPQAEQILRRHDGALGLIAAIISEDNNR